MSHFDYEISRQIDAQQYPFHALIMAAMRRADTANDAKLASAFPDIKAELQKRYWTPGGLLPGEMSP